MQRQRDSDEIERRTNRIFKSTEKKGTSKTIKVDRNPLLPHHSFITNNDGRISDVLPPGRQLIPGTYTMTFKTEKYYGNNNQKGFYPEVSIRFEVTFDSQDQIPLLINPFGYSTYRGS